MSKKMSKADKAMLIAVIVIAVFGIGTFAVKQGVKLPFKTFALSAPSDYFLIPTFGYLKCDRISCTTKSVRMSGQYAQIDKLNQFSATPYTCQNFVGLNDGCQITLQTTNGNIDSSLHSMQQLAYQVVPQGTPFNENSAIILSGGLFGYDDGERIILTLSSTDVVWVRF